MGKLTNEQYKELKDLVYTYKTKHEYGFNSFEQADLLSKFEGKINMDKYEDALCGITCMMDEELQQFIIYPCDIFSALLCGLENRDQTLEEWD